jgi:hypothetical protein
MAFVVIFAVGLAALRNPSDLWAGMMVLVALAAVGFAVMAAVILRGRERHWWAGFAFFGAGYLALAFGPWLGDRFRPQLGTTHILREAHSSMTRGGLVAPGDLPALRAQREILSAKLQQAASLARTGNADALKSAKQAIATLNRRIDALTGAAVFDRFEHVGHCLFALLAGL